MLYPTPDADLKRPVPGIPPSLLPVDHRSLAYPQSLFRRALFNGSGKKGKF